MTVYTQALIMPHHAGFGMYQMGEVHCGPETSYALKAYLLAAIEQNVQRFSRIEDALEDEQFKREGVEDIRGRIYNQRGEIYAYILQDESGVHYCAIIESEVADDFYK